MRGYGGLDRNLGPWIRFVTNDEISEELLDCFVAARSTCLIAYVDAMRLVGGVADHLGTILPLEHPPYGLNWVRFLDDLLGLSYTTSGLAIVIDNATSLFARPDREAFNFIEAFEIQLYHWWEQDKPCHLCFQMDECPDLKTTIEKSASLS